MKSYKILLLPALLGIILSINACSFLSSEILEVKPLDIKKQTGLLVREWVCAGVQIQIAGDSDLSFSDSEPMDLEDPELVTLMLDDFSGFTRNVALLTLDEEEIYDLRQEGLQRNNSLQDYPRLLFADDSASKLEGLFESVYRYGNGFQLAVDRDKYVLRQPMGSEADWEAKTMSGVWKLNGSMPDEEKVKYFFAIRLDEVNAEKIDNVENIPLKWEQHAIWWSDDYKQMFFKPSGYKDVFILVPKEEKKYLKILRKYRLLKK